MLLLLTLVRYFQPWRPVVSQNSLNIILTEVLTQPLPARLSPLSSGPLLLLRRRVLLEHRLAVDTLLDVRVERRLVRRAPACVRAAQRPVHVARRQRPV